MYLLNIVKATKKVSINEIKDFIFETCYKRIGFSKENSCYSVKRLKKSIYYCLQANYWKKYLIPVITKENRKSVKQSEQPKAFDTVYIKSITTDYPKTSHKLFKTIRQAKK